MTASLRPVASMPAFSRALYGLVSVNSAGRSRPGPRSCSVQSPSNSIRSRSAALMRKWCAHFGQTFRLVGEILVVDRPARSRDT